ncbi:MAG: leucine-rich repeat domain-containing protein, partial [Bacteroidales bacterium]|nr:leucine-rich repeat domain-containing protein [Candidatus Cryptobacteroides equifaecalis]
AAKIQILYCSQNNLEELPEEVKNFKAMGLIDLMSNKISKVAPFGHDINLVDCYLDNNKITSIGRDEDGFFCGIEDIETFSASYNQMTEMPDIFTSKSRFIMGSVDFSYNKISQVENAGTGNYRGLKVSTLTLANNPITVFPKEFSESSSIVSFFNMRGCFINEVPKEAFEGETMINTTSIDLSYNHLSKLPSSTFNGTHLPYLYGVDLGYNRFTNFPYEVLDSAYLTVCSLRGQRDSNGNRCLREWPQGIYQHKGLRGLYLGSNDLRKISDTISPLIYFLDISDNPNITFDASDICYEWRMGAYILIYDKTQNIINCDYMLQ